MINTSFLWLIPVLIVMWIPTPLIEKLDKWAKGSSMPSAKIVKKIIKIYDFLFMLILTSFVAYVLFVLPLDLLGILPSHVHF